MFFGGGTPDTSDTSYWDGDLPWVSSQDVRGGGLTSTARRITDAGLKNSSARIATAGSLVFVMRSGILKHSLPVSLLEMDAAVNQDIKSLYPVRLWDARYLLYFFAGWQAQLLAAWRTQGATVESLRFDLMQKTLLPCPARDAQAAIVAYLDAEVSRIDSLIERKQRFIDLLLERRTALITHAVTKGLDQTAEMKDTAVEWYGLSPSHWKSGKLGHIGTTSGGCTPSKEEPRFWGGDVPWVTPKDMKVREVSDSLDHVTTEAMAETGLRYESPGAVLVVVRGMILARTVPVAVNTVPITMNQDMKAIRCAAGVEPRFLLCVLEGLSGALQTIVEEAAHGTRCLRTDLWNTFRIMVPPIDEQREIVSFLDAETAKIDALVGRTLMGVNLLKEYRTALISAVVTGQIEVGN